MLLNISITVLCLSTLLFFLGTRLYVPILRFFFRDTAAAKTEGKDAKKKSQGDKKGKEIPFKRCLKAGDSSQDLATNTVCTARWSELQTGLRG